MKQRLSERDDQTMSRRTFLGGSLAFAGTMGMAALGGCQPVGARAQRDAAELGGTNGSGASEGGSPLSFFEPPRGTVAFEADQVPENSIAKTEEVDLVVCGAGLAGVVLSLAASERGLKTVLLEKTAGMNVRGSGIGSLSCSVVKEAGIVFDERAYLDDALKAALYRCDAEIWRTWVERNGEAVDWLIEATKDAITPYLNLPDSGAAVDTFGGVNTYNDTIEAKEGMVAWAQAALDKAIENGTSVRYSTPAVQLVREQDRGVTGVVAKSMEDGSYLRLTASKGVALCTGGYENNLEMLRENMRPEDLNVVAWRLPNTENTGDGQLMGEAIGGVLEPRPHIMMRDPGGSAAAHSSMTFLSCRWPRVNKLGKRFVNECISHNDLANAFMRQPGGRDWIILAGPTLKEAMEGTTYKDHTPGARKQTAEQIIEQAKDVIVQADTLEELAQATGIDPENLQETCRRITELHANGEDVDFGTDPGMLMSFESGPYYAAEEGASNLVTVSGLVVTSDSEVVDGDGRAIPGLYALGNCSGGMFNDSYPHELSAISHSRCVVFSYLLARHLAEA